jgi:transketolase
VTEITKAKAKLWSRIGTRAVFGQAILECAKERDDFYVLSADLAQSSGLGRFRSEFPERMINTGIAEQNMIGVAAGLAKDGTNVFATSFSPFVTMRACEQVRMNMGYMQLNIKTVGLGSGLIMAQLGNSHFGLEDGSVMRSIPGMTVINPADGAAIIKTVEALCDFKGPAYLRLTGGPGLPIVYEEGFDFRIGKAISVREGKDIAIIAAGTMVYYARKAAEILAEKGIDAAVIDMHTIKPLDTEAIIASAKKTGAVVVAEEHNMAGGLGEAVAGVLARELPTPVVFVNGEDKFGQSGTPSALMAAYGLDAPHIAEAAKKAIAKK